MVGDPVVGVSMVGDPVAGDAVVGDAVEGDAVVGNAVAGISVVGDPVVGVCLVGDSVEGVCVVGDSVVRVSVVGGPVVGDAVVVRHVGVLVAIVGFGSHISASRMQRVSHILYPCKHETQFSVSCCVHIVSVATAPNLHMQMFSSQLWSGNGLCP